MLRFDGGRQFLGRLSVDLGVEDDVPELVGDTVADMAEFVMVLHVVGLEVAEVLRHVGTVMQVIVDQVVAHVSHTEAGHEWAEVWVRDGQRNQRMNDSAVENVAGDGRENKTQAVARERMMNAVDHEMARVDPLVSRRNPHPVVFAVEQEAVQRVLSERPSNEAEHDGDEVGVGVGRVLRHLVVTVAAPEERNIPPMCLRASLKEPMVEQPDVAHRVGQNLGLVDVLNIFLKGPFRIEDLP